jgi:hypothetical protein
MRSTYATRVSAGGATAEWVTQLLRQGDAKVFKKYLRTRLQMKREYRRSSIQRATGPARVFGQAG